MPGAAVISLCLRRVALAFAALALVPALVQWATAAPPSIASLFPPGVPRGATTEVTVTGTLDPWPVQLWCDRPGVSITAGEKKGTLAVTVDEDVAPGVALVRIYNDQGASALRPLMIGHLPEIVEKEPNDAVAQAQKIEAAQLEGAGIVVNGRYDKADDVDTYAVPLKAGQTLVATIESNFTLGRQADASLQVASDRGFVLRHNDDARGMDPLVVYTAEADGTYLIRTFCFPAVPNATIRYAGGADLLYRLTITTTGYVDHVEPLAVSQTGPTEVRPRGWSVDAAPPQPVAPVGSGEPSQELAEAVVFWPNLAGVVNLPRVPHPVVVEKEPNHEPAQAQSIQWPVVISGAIGTPGDRDCFRFEAAKGDNLSMAVQSWKLGYELDVHLTLYDAEGKMLRELDDTVRNEREAELVFRFPADGQYVLQVRDLYHHGGLRYPYRLTIAPAEPDFALTVAADRFVIAAGKPLEIPVTVTRTHGFAGEIKVEALDLPEGIVCEAVTSQPTGDTAKAVKLVLTAQGETAVNGPLRIQGQGAHQAKGAEEPGPTRIHAATATIENTTLATPHLWLNTEPAAAKKDGEKK